MKAFETIVDRPFEEAERTVRAALAEEGFGVLTEIDVAATLNAKLGVVRAPLKILGACNPHLAHRALELDPSVSLVLPCNVVLEAIDGRTKVAVADPRALMPDARLAQFTADAARRLEAVVTAVARRSQG